MNKIKERKKVGAVCPKCKSPEYKNYGKGVLSFGKHKGKTIKEIINNGDYGYVVWLSDNVRRITVSESDYNYCKRMVAEDKAMHEAVMESRHGDWGCRD